MKVRSELQRTKEVAELGRNDLIGCKIITTKKMKEEILTLENPFYAYLFGLIQTDGHLYQNSRNRGTQKLPNGSEMRTVNPFSKLY